MSYKVLNTQTFSNGEFSIVPIRMQDRYDIMNWRNEQIYHLRQDKILTKEDQDNYFEKVVLKLFDQDTPNQILFSYLKNNECIGYGGLVHINWIDKNAEISFIMNTSLEKETFQIHWNNFLNLIQRVGFLDLNLHKLFTYAFDIRSHLYLALEKSGFKFEAELKEHCYYQNNFISVKIHSKTMTDCLQLRLAMPSDLEITYNWAKNPEIRFFSFNNDPISREEHESYFLDKLNFKNCEYYILEFNGNPAGSIRFDFEQKNRMAKISYLIDPEYSGKGLGTMILKKGMGKLKERNPAVKAVYGFVFKNNIASVRIFEKLLFQKISESEKDFKYEKELA